MGSDDLLHDAQPGDTPTGERMLLAILNSLSEAVITVGRDHRIASFNRAAERLVGIRGVEALGKDCREVLRASFGPAQHDCPMGELGNRASRWAIARPRPVPPNRREVDASA